jgi:hypothetical protein
MGNWSVFDLSFYQNRHVPETAGSADGDGADLPLDVLLVAEFFVYPDFDFANLGNKYDTPFFFNPKLLGASEAVMPALLVKCWEFGFAVKKVLKCPAQVSYGCLQALGEGLTKPRIFFFQFR